MDADKYYLSPLYRVMELIECFILDNNLKSHDKLPGERKLCEMWECNRVTLRTAFDCLENAGKTYSIKGMGNYVAEEKIEISLTSYDSFFHQLKQLKQKPVMELLSFSTTKPSAKICEYLGMQAADDIYEIKTLLYLDDVPVILETGRICAGEYSSVTERDLEENDIFQVLQERYGIVLEYGSAEISITNAQDEEAEYLEIEEGEPLFYVMKTGGTKDKAIICSQAAIRPEKIQFASLLK